VGPEYSKANSGEKKRRAVVKGEKLVRGAVVGEDDKGGVSDAHKREPSRLKLCDYAGPEGQNYGVNSLRIIT